MSATPARKFLHAPPAVDQGSSATGLRAVAILEASKGLLVVAAAIVLIALRGRIEDYTEDLLYHLHVDFDHRFAHILLDAASKLTGAPKVTLALASSGYAAIRFVEAWGLWRRRVWAEWFALVSGTLYLPWEIAKVAERATWFHIGILAVNVVIILYMLEIRVRAMRSRAKQAKEGTAGI
ncbi:MAG TPA: DUF2127 domain-containing protein [Bryobacteraceae bacterium]|nr:DUF2127 domain-containing protein [Bryobacteraceae bacterium]